MSMVDKIDELLGACAAQATSKEELEPNVMLLSEDAYYSLIGELRRSQMVDIDSTSLFIFKGMCVCRVLDTGFSVGVFHKRPDGQMRGNVA